MGSWAESMRRQQQADRAREAQATLEINRDAESKDSEERKKRKILADLVADLNVTGLLTSLNQELWASLGVIERSQGNDWRGGRYTQYPQVYWDQISLIFRYKKYSAIAEPVVKTRFGDYTETRYAKSGGEWGQNQYNSYTVKRFGFHKVQTGVKTVGVKEEDTLTSTSVRLSLQFNTYGEDGGFELKFGDPYTAAGGRPFWFEKTQLETARQFLEGGLAKISIGRSSAGQFPPQLAEVERKNLERIRSEMGQVRP